MNCIVFPLPEFQHYLRRLVQDPVARCDCPLGIFPGKYGIELLITSSQSDREHYLLLAYTQEFVLPQRLPARYRGVLLLNREQYGTLQGWVKVAEHFEPCTQLRLIGAGMYSIPMITGHIEQMPEIPDIETSAHSRTIGALGKDVWQRLTNLHYGIIGMGRSGSNLSQALIRMGVQQFTLIDPDNLELHNLGEMWGVAKEDIADSKVQAVANSLQKISTTANQISMIRNSITRLESLQAAQNCDFLFCCVDHDSARIATAIIAVLFHKPLIDIATGIHGAGNQRRMGADIRLFLPGRCLLCFGGVQTFAQAVQVLSSATIEDEFYRQRDWQRERNGSLASLNQFAVAIAMRLLEDLIAERIIESTWVHAEFSPTGTIDISYPQPAHTHCPLCSLSGSAQQGIERARAILFT